MRSSDFFPFGRHSGIVSGGQKVKRNLEVVALVGSLTTPIAKDTSVAVNIYSSTFFKYFCK